jgi:hypothetical protein
MISTGAGEPLTDAASDMLRLVRRVGWLEIGGFYPPY